VIKDGVRPGEKVVTNGQLRLAPGVKVIVQPAQEKAVEMKKERSTSNFQRSTFNAGNMAVLLSLWTLKVER
jgi:hypothetical protein